MGPVLAIFGPTAVGKTAVAIAMADRLRERGEDPVAISVDALQVYAGLETLTGVATAQERARLEHRLVALVMDREELYRRIDARVDAIVAAGARDEARRAAEAGASETARQALGFQELLDGDIEAMKRRTRRYARRQLTWLRKLPDAELVDLTGREPGDVARDLLG